jgi:hypothetical protein
MRFVRYQGEPNLTGWPHTIPLGEPNIRDSLPLVTPQKMPQAHITEATLYTAQRSMACDMCATWHAATL